LMFALGYGLQDVLTPKDANTPLVNKYGIIYRPDMSFTVKDPAMSSPSIITTAPLATMHELEQLVEIKTTRRSAKNHYMDEYIPQTWLDYMMGGCTMIETNEYDLIVLYLMGNYSPPFPQIYCDTFYFNSEELEANWAKILERKEVLDKSLETGKPPTSFQNCYDWECDYCRYVLVCNTLVTVLEEV